MPADPAQPAPAANEPGLAKGATIGRYVVLGLLGRGGMGEVYAAYDPELDRKIAIKLLRARGNSSAAAADGKTRLLREAQAIARLSHPNVVVVYDVGTFRDSVFIAMEFVEGHTLGYWLEAQPRKTREVLDVFMAAGRGLVAAHAAGLVHRDFKPDNVMITKTGQVRVMDFGLARHQSQEDEPSPAGQQVMDAEARAAALAATMEPDVDPDATAELASGSAPDGPVASSSGGYLRVKLTATGAILGTPAYMAPEQFAGTGGDARTDQFSFAVALYEGLYGGRPFAGQNVIALMANVVSGTISPAPENTRVPPWLRRILLRGLATKPADRFPSMTDMLAALSHDPAVRRRRWLVAAAGVTVIAAAVIGLNRLSSGQRALCAGGPARVAGAWGPTQRRAAERAFVRSGNKNGATLFASSAGIIDQYVARWTGMYTDACEATHVRGEQSTEVLDLRMGCLGQRLSGVKALADVFTSADASVVDNAVHAAGGLATLDGCADVTMLRAVIKPPDDPAIRARVAELREATAKLAALAWSGQCQRATADGEKMVAAATTLGYLPLKAEILLILGRLGQTCTDPAKAAEQLEEASFAAESSNHDEVVIYAAAFAALIHADRLHDPGAAQRWTRHGEAILARFPGHPLLEASMTDARGVTLHNMRRHDDAIREAQRALALKEAALGASHEQVSTSLQNLGLFMADAGRYAEAEPITARALELSRKLFGNDGAAVAEVSLNYGEVLTSLRRYPAAEAAFEEAIGIWRRQGASDFFIGYGQFDVGKLRLAEGNLRAARLPLEEAVDVLAKHDPQVTADAEFALARALWAPPADRARALTLARKAQVVIALDKGGARRLAEVDAWLAERK